MNKAKAQLPRNTKVASEAVRLLHEKRMTHAPVIVNGISKGELVVVRPAMFPRLDVDPLYQRGETRMVSQLTRVLQAGGKILDPVTLCWRKGGDTWWVVDGHQRVCAFQALKMEFAAMLHNSESAEAEHAFFIALNAKVGVSANVIVKAWTGPSGTLIRKANESPEHPLYDRVNLQQASNDAKMAASTIARALQALIVADNSNPISVMLSRIDMAMTAGEKRARAEHFLRLVGRICPKGYMPALVLRALAIVAAERWRKELEMPSPKVIERLRVKQWATEVVLVQKYFPVLLDTIRKIWRETA